MRQATRFYSISEINSLVKDLFDNNPILHHITIKGEISNFRRYPKAFYFSLKDNQSQLSAIMFFNFRSNIDYTPKDGDEVLALGSLKVYEKAGRYQLIVEDIIQYGFGEQLINLQQLKAKLEREGLFSESRKRPIPIYPKEIGVVAGDESAALKDIVTNINRRYPLARIYFFPALVQGKQAPDDIIRALSLAYTYPIDTLIIGRGGGSEEDLSAFNEDKVVRHIAASPIPTIGAIGHEINTTLADYVCDKRASTPTGAAEFATRDKTEIYIELGMLAKQLCDSVSNRIDIAKEALRRFKEKPYFLSPRFIFEKKVQDIMLMKEKMRSELIDLLKQAAERVSRIELTLINPLPKVRQYVLQCANDNSRIQSALLSRLDMATTEYINTKKQLDALSPFSVLERGYSILTNVTGSVITSSSDVKEGEVLTTTLKHGKITSVVKERE